MTGSSPNDFLGHQNPTILHIPERALPVSKEAVALAEAAGLVLDDWQKMLLVQSLAETEDKYWNDLQGVWAGKYAAFEVGLVVSRQNGKTALLEARMLAGLFLQGEHTIVHSAHMFDTAKEAFERIESRIADNPELKREVRKVTYSHGDEGIYMRNGARLRFRTRTKGGGRGFTIDTLLFDEAMILNSDQVAALMPTMSAVPNPQIWYTGSAGDKDSIHLARVRKRGIQKSDPRLLYAEWSINPCDQLCPKDCDDHDAIDSAESYAKSNPGLGIRIDIEHINSERRAMDETTFLRERLGVGTWPVEGAAYRVIEEEAWLNRVDPNSSIHGRPVFAVDVTPDKSWAAIGVAGENGEGMWHVEIPGHGLKWDHRTGTRWIVPRMKELYRRHKGAAVVLYRGAQAGDFYEEFEALGMNVLTPTMREYAQACGGFFSSVVARRGNEPDLVHLNNPPLTSAVAGADKKETDDLWRWDRISAASDISPLVATTLALWGAKKIATKPKSKPKAAWR